MLRMIEKSISFLFATKMIAKSWSFDQPESMLDFGDDNDLIRDHELSQAKIADALGVI